MKPGRHRVEERDRYKALVYRITSAFNMLGIKPRIVREYGRTVAYAISKRYSSFLDSIVLKHGLNYKYFSYKFLTNRYDLLYAVISIYLDYWLLNRIAYRFLIYEKFHYYNSLLDRNYLLFEQQLIDRILDLNNVSYKELSTISNPWELWDYIRVCGVQEVEEITQRLYNEIPREWEVFVKYIISKFRSNMRRFYIDALRVLNCL